MARYTDSVCKLCRREGVKLFLKGTRCATEKCAIERRSYPPGQHGQAKQRLSEYGTQLREKQKLKRIYGLLERQFATYFEKSDKKTGMTGENLLKILESRLDNVVYRLGFSASRKQSRMLIRQNHFRVNGKGVNIPSYLVSVNDVIEVREGSRAILPIQDALQNVTRRTIPAWLELDRTALKGRVQSEPLKADIPVREQLVVELCSR